MSSWLAIKISCKRAHESRKGSYGRLRKKKEKKRIARERIKESFDEGNLLIVNIILIARNDDDVPPLKLCQYFPVNIRPYEAVISWKCYRSVTCAD